MAHALANIAETGARQANARDALDQPLANERARKGAGIALATMLIDETQQQAGKLRMFVQSLMDLDADGRKGFIEYLGEVMKERKALVKENGTTLYKTINASASVRLSEFRTIAKAMGDGFAPDLTQNYHTIVGLARELLASKGKKDTRGRKPTHGLVKAMKYLEKLEALDETDAAMIGALRELAEKLALDAGLTMETEVAPF
jgi:hypothetical protein